MKLLDVVVFEETGEERVVRSFCRRCERNWESRADMNHEAFRVISPYGVAHTGAEYGMTGCGIDATGDKWWWPL